MPEESKAAALLPLAAEIVVAHLSNAKVPAPELSQLIRSVYSILAEIGAGAASEVKPEPAVSAKKSISPDYLVCIDCGAKMKMLKRHLRTAHKLSVDQYRARWGLTADYPVVAANYAKTRSKLAKAIGLGTKPRRRKAQALASKIRTRSKRIARK